MDQGRLGSIFAFIFLSLTLVSCAGPRRNTITPLLKDKEAGIFVFLAPDCPLSQNYTLTLNDLYRQLKPDDLIFEGVFAGNTSQNDIDAFVNTYHVAFPVMRDPDFKITDFFGATTTPQAFLTDGHGQTVYKGAIDNWAPELGAHRTVITQHYLHDAVQGLLANKPIAVKETQAVGCFIERNQS